MSLVAALKRLTGLFLFFVGMLAANAEDCVKGYHLFYKGELVGTPYDIDNFSFDGSGWLHVKWRDEAEAMKFQQQRGAHGSVWVTSNALRFDTNVVAYEMMTSEQILPSILVAQAIVLDHEVIRKVNKHVISISGRMFPREEVLDSEPALPPSLSYYHQYDEDDSLLTSFSIDKKPQYLKTDAEPESFVFASKFNKLPLSLVETKQRVNGFEVFQEKEQPSLQYVRIYDNYIPIVYQPNLSGLSGSLALASIQEACLQENNFYVPNAIVDNTAISYDDLIKSFTKK